MSLTTKLGDAVFAVHLRQASDPSSSPETLAALLRLYAKDSAVTIAVASNPNSALTSLLGMLNTLDSDESDIWSWYRGQLALTWAMRENPSMPLWELEDPAFPAEFETLLQMGRWKYAWGVSTDAQKKLFFAQELRRWLPYLEKWSNPSYPDALAWVEAMERGEVPIGHLAYEGIANKGMITLALATASNKPSAFRKHLTQVEKDMWRLRDQVVGTIEEMMNRAGSVMAYQPAKAMVEAEHAATLNGGVGLLPEAQSGSYHGGVPVACTLGHVAYRTQCAARMEAILG